MTLDEAIKHADELAEEQDKLCKRYDDASGYTRSHNEDIRTTDAKKCIKCAAEHRQLAEWLKELKQLREQTGWIPIKTRPLTKEEKEEFGHEYAYMYDCPLPDDGQDVLITDWCGNVEIDTFCRDYDAFYFETNCDDGEVIAWMPLPTPYKAESKIEQALAYADQDTLMPAT